MERREVIGEKRGGEGGARVALRERGVGERKKTRPAAAPWAPRVVERRRRRRRRPPPSPPTTRWRGGRGGESRLQVFRSLMCDLPQTRQSVPPFPSGSAGIKESALGPPPPPSPSPSPLLLRLLTKPYRYSVLYRRSRLTFFPGREEAFGFPEKRENAPREGGGGERRPR